jgi:MFS transporter, SP family, sugar:H+ symporter
MMSVQTGTQQQGSLAWVIFLSFVATIGGFLFGFDSGVINGTVDALQKAFGSTASGTGFNVSSMLIGCAVGAFFAGALADRFGRKPLLLATAVAFTISAWGSGIAHGATEFVVYRVLGGLAVGAASILAPAYISEIAPPHIRGRLATLQQMMIVIGLFMAFLSNYLIAKAAGGSASAMFWGGWQAWQWMFWMEIFPALLFFVCLLFIPESPRFLVAAGRNHRAEAVLSRISGTSRAKTQVEAIQSTMEAGRKPSLADLFNRVTNRVHPVVLAGLAIAVLQQFTGINVVMYYGSVLWQSAGFSEGDSLLVNVISGCVNVGFTFVAVALVDRIGRRPLLLAGALGQAVMLAILAVIFASADRDPGLGLHLGRVAGTGALLAANAYIAFFAATWGPVVWVMLGEMFPNQCRGAALAVCGLAGWFANFLVTMTFPILLATFDLGITYMIYAAFGLVAWFFVRRFVEETKGRSLEEMSRC